MTFPKDLSGRDLIKHLKRLGYEQTRQVGSHIRITTREGGTHHVTIPDHKPLKLGTFSGILRDVGTHFNKSKEEIWELIR